jgi:hypothetical protein
MLAWERQAGEADKAYRAFSYYRDLGPERSLRAVAEALYGTRWKHGKRTVEKWSSRFDWVSRTQALEARDSMIKLEAVETHLEAQADDHGRREAALVDRALSLREKAAEQADKMLEWPLTQQRVVPDEDGGGVTYIFTPAGWNKGTAIAFYNMMIGSGQRPADPEAEIDWTGWSEEELIEYSRLVAKAWGQEA